MGEYKETVLGLNKLEQALIVAVLMILGAIIGWFIPVIAEGALKLPVIPLEKIIAYIASLNHFRVSIVATIIGIFAGLILSFLLFRDSLKATVADHQLKLELEDSTKIIERKHISAVYYEKKRLVVLGQRGHELYRAVLDTKLDSVRVAFQRHGYPWKDADPFAGQYQRWILDNPNFSSHIHSLLNARERAIKESNKKEARHLREDLAIAGIVIRDEKDGQYVRSSGG